MRMFLPPDSEANCVLQGVNQTRTSLDMREICTGLKPSTLTISIKAKDPKQFVARLTASANGTTEHMQMNAKWIQDSCDGFTE